MTQKVRLNENPQKCDLHFHYPFLLYAHCGNTFLFTEGSSKDYREPKDKEPESSSSESDDDECGAPSDYTKPTTDKSKFQLDYIQQFFKNKLGLSHEEKSEADTRQVLKTIDFQGLVDHWKGNGFKKIVTMVGAGISTCKKFEIT